MAILIKHILLAFGIVYFIYRTNKIWTFIGNNIKAVIIESTSKTHVSEERQDCSDQKPETIKITEYLSQT